MKPIKALVFDWGDTLMRDYPEQTGPMVSWPVVEALPGVPESLEQLSRDFICCVATNAAVSNAELMGHALARVNIHRHFRYRFTARELGVRKPDPQFFRTVAARMGLEPEECIMIGEKYASDIVGAKRAGMQTVWLASDESELQGEEADAVIRSMADLPEAIRHLAGAAV